MSTDLYAVRVLEKTPSDVLLRIFCIYHGETGVPPASASRFFLLLLQDGVEDIENATVPKTTRSRARALAEEVPFAQLLDVQWCQANANRFIVAVTMLTETYAGNPVAFPEECNVYAEFLDPRFEERLRLPQATYRLTVLDPRYIAHLFSGDVWGTAAFP